MSGPTNTNRRVGRMWKVFLWGLFVLLALLGGTGLYFVYDYQRRWTPEQVERAVNEGVSAESTRAEVEVWLDAKGFPRRYYDSYHDVESSARKAGVAEADFGVALVASVPEPNLGLLVGGWINIDFFFDKNGRLIKTYLNVERFYL